MSHVCKPAAPICVISTSIVLVDLYKALDAVQRSSHDSRPLCTLSKCLINLHLQFSSSVLLRLNYVPDSFAPSLPSPPLIPIQFAQELLSTFALSLGEVALIPSTGGVFVVDIFHDMSGRKTEDEDAREGEKSTGGIRVESTRLWDRKVEGGFPGMLTFESVDFWSW